MGQTDKQAVVHSPVPQSYSTSDKRYNERSDAEICRKQYFGGKRDTFDFGTNLFLAEIYNVVQYMQNNAEASTHVSHCTKCETFDCRIVLQSILPLVIAKNKRPLNLAMAVSRCKRNPQ